MKKTVVIGASTNPERYSYLAVQRLRNNGHPVIAIGQKEGVIHGVTIETELPNEKMVDTITLYLNPKAQENYYDYIFSLHPKRIIFNPGTENETLEAMAKSKGIEAIEACTLVMLNTGQY